MLEPANFEVRQIQVDLTEAERRKELERINDLPSIGRPFVKIMKPADMMILQ